MNRPSPRRALPALVLGLAMLLPACSAPGGGGDAGAGASSGPSPSGDAAPGGPLPSEEELARAREDVAKLPVAKLAAQVVVPRQSGGPDEAGASLREGGYGGLAVFAENLPADGAVEASRRTTRAARGAMDASGRDWPAFVSIDQEGGPVARIGAPLTRFPAAMALGAAGDAAPAREVGRASGAELRGLGYTVVMAPVADVTSGPQDPTIGARSPGSDPATVGRVSTGLAQGYADAGLVPTLKHFPGHGSVVADTHLGAARQDADAQTLRERDLVPFAAGVAAGVPAIMSAHITVPDLDPREPATLSKPVLTGLLRQEMGFRGLVVTDALDMGAIDQRHGDGQAGVLALAAGADVLLMPKDPARTAAAIAAAVDDGTLPKERLVEAAARMVATLRHAEGVGGTGAEPGSHEQVARRLAAASITQIAGRCGQRLVGDGIVVSGGDEADRAGLEAAARAAGLATGSGTRVTLLGGGAYQAGSGEGSGAARGSGDVVVALDVPYGLAQSDAPTKLATYGRTPATFAGLVDVLLGKSPAQGHLPVKVGSDAIGSGCGANG